MKYRHTALFFMFADGSTTALHLNGSPGDFTFEPMDGYRPDNSIRLVRRIDVGEVRDFVSPELIRGVVTRTPISKDMDWNCQNWVGDALARMVKNQYLTESERHTAIDTMVTVILEAKDEP